MAKKTRLQRGEIMRLIAAKYAKLDLLNRSTDTGMKRLEEREKIKGQIAELKEQMLA